MPVVDETGTPGSLGGRIRAARQARGWSMNELDKRLGTSEGYTSRVESGSRVPREDKIRAYAITLDVHYEWLLEGKGPRDRTSSSSSHRRHPNLEAAIAGMGERVTPGAAEVARAMGAESRRPGRRGLADLAARPLAKNLTANSEIVSRACAPSSGDAQ